MSVFIFLLTFINIFFASIFGDVIIEKATPSLSTSFGLSYDNNTDTLYFADVYKPALCSLHQNETVCVHVPDVLYLLGVIQVKNVQDVFIGVVAKSIVYLNVTRDSAGKMSSIITTPIKQIETSFTHLFSAYYVNADGHLYIDSVNILSLIGINNGKLYKVDPDLTVTTLISNASLPAAVGVNRAGTALYHGDAGPNNVVRYDINKTKGEITNRQVIFEVKKDTNVTALICSVTVPEDDSHIWIGLCLKGEIILYNWKTKTTEQIIQMPVEFPESIAMSGLNLDEMWVGTVIHPELDFSFTATGAVYNVKGLTVKGQRSYKLSQYN